MIGQALFFEISLANNFNVYVYIDNNFRNPSTGYFIIGTLFWFGVFSIFINTFGAIYLLIKRQHFFIVIICVIAVILYSYHALLTMKEF